MFECLVRKRRKSQQPSLDDYGCLTQVSLELWTTNIIDTLERVDIKYPTKYFGSLLADIHGMYDARLPFHNQKHVHDVFQMGMCLLARNPYTLRKLTEKQKWTFCLALLCHDLDHRGYTNSDIKNGNYEYDDDEYSDDTASMCSNESYNEMHHITLSNKLLKNYQVDYDKQLFAKLIAFTDLVSHRFFLQSTMESEGKDIEQTLVGYMKLADIGHILRPWEHHLSYVMALNRERNIPLDLIGIPNDTIWFNTTFVLPLINMFENKNIGLHNKLMSLYTTNMSIWRTIHTFTNASIVET